MTGILMALILTQSGITEAPSQTRQVAETYMQAYQAQDFEVLETLYSDDALFVDPTSYDVAPITSPIRWEGPDAIIAGLQGWGVARMTYSLDRSFEASGQVIYDGVSDVVYATANGPVTYRFPIITIITVEDGQVSEHRDYTDYAGMQRLTDSPRP